jgi:hypothetical protein
VDAHRPGVMCLSAKGKTTQRCRCGWESEPCDSSAQAIDQWLSHSGGIDALLDEEVDGQA